MTSVDPVDGPPTTAPERAEMKRRLSVAYDRGRKEERSHHHGGGVLAVIVGLVAVIGAGMLALAFEQGSFAAGGAVIDGQIAQVRAAADNATGQARAKAGAALSSAGQSVQQVGSNVAGQPKPASPN
jgi:hypothetical protein